MKYFRSTSNQIKKEKIDSFLVCLLFNSSSSSWFSLRSFPSLWKFFSMEIKVYVIIRFENTKSDWQTKTCFFFYFFFFFIFLNFFIFSWITPLDLWKERKKVKQEILFIYFFSSKMGNTKLEQIPAKAWNWIENLILLFFFLFLRFRFDSNHWNSEDKEKDHDDDDKWRVKKKKKRH